MKNYTFQRSYRAYGGGYGKHTMTAYVGVRNKVPVSIIEILVDKLDSVLHDRLWTVHIHSVQSPTSRYSDWDLFGDCMDGNGKEYSFGCTNMPDGNYLEVTEMD